MVHEDPKVTEQENLGLISRDVASIAQIMNTSLKGVHNRIEYLETRVKSLLETNGKQFETVKKGINGIQTLIAHMYSGDDRTRQDKILEGRVGPSERIMKDDIMHLLLEQVLIRDIAKDLRSANYEQFSAIGG